MNLEDYIEPSAATPAQGGVSKDASLYGKLIKYHTSNPRTDIAKGSLVILGIPEHRNSSNAGAAHAPDAIRRYLFALSGSEIRKPIVDIGNLRPTASPAQTYAALSDVASYIASRDAVCIVLGGTQELTWPIYQSLSESTGRINLSLIDSIIDMENTDGDFSAKCFMSKLTSEPLTKLYAINILGYQSYLNNHNHLTALQQKHHEVQRLGFIRNSMVEVEPILRDTHIVSLDMCSIRQSDSPGTVSPSPNGLYAEEACQLARYSGNSPRIKFFGLFDLNTLNDPQGQSQHLAAQIVWHFIEAYYQRKDAALVYSEKDLKRFYIKSPIPKVEMVFIKNSNLNYWWLELPVDESGVQSTLRIACSHNDYLKASQGDVPNRWLNALKKMR